MPTAASKRAATRTTAIPSLKGGASNPVRAVANTVAAITAMPPPCGVGVVCDDRALGRASA